MKHLSRIAFTLLAVSSVLTLTVATASAAGTTIRRDSALGAPYSGKDRATLLSPNATFSGVTRLTGIRLTTTCNFVQIDGTTNSDGTGQITSAIVRDGTSTSCPNNLGGRTTITPVGLPYPAHIVFGPVGGRDGTQVVTGVKIKAVVTFLGATITCNYAGNETLNVYNKDNPNRPNAAAELQIEAKNINIGLDPAQANGADCPLTTTTNSVVRLRGEKVAGSGSFDQVLYVTA